MAKRRGADLGGVKREPRTVTQIVEADQTSGWYDADGNRTTAPSPREKKEGAVAVLRDGPRDGWLYFVDDLLVQQRAYEATGHGMPMRYRPTKPVLTEVHGDHVCDVWYQT